jgi:hypothetical protein
MAFDTRELSEVRSSPRSSVGALIKFPGGSIIGSFLSIAILCTLATLSAKANDSTVELATGGLAFVKNNNIEMLSENLFISADEIRVRYRFLNKSKKNITVHVAFPLPDLKAEGEDAFVLPTDDPVNFVGFATKVDGRPIHTNVEQKIYIEGRDQTEALKRLGIPLSPFRSEAVLDKLSTAKTAQLRRLGLINSNRSPLWTLKTTFYWQQQFASGHETIIEHHYKPSVGDTVQLPSAGLGQYLKDRGDDRKYCVDADFLAALGKANGDFSQQRIEYVLKTGANWSGPIKEFHLVVDKGAPGNLVTFCGQGVKQIGPTQFEMRKSGFIPQENLAVLILERVHQPQTQ